jgi:hypothetical protein
MTSYEQLDLLNQLAELTELFSSLKISPVDIRAFDENTLISPKKKTIKIKKNQNRIKKYKLIIQPDDVDVPIESKVDTNVSNSPPIESKVDTNVSNSPPIESKVAILEKQTIGWLYIFYSPVMPGLYKIGMTNRTVEARLAEANIHFTYGVPIPYICLYARKVKNALASEKEIHKILNKFRVNKHYEFFGVVEPKETDEILTFERIKSLFDEIPGEVWVEQIKDTKRNRHNITNFDDHQQIRYKNHDGVYNREEKGIIYNGTVYKSLSKFAQACDPGRKNIDGWKECTYLSESGEWIAANNK